MAANGVQMLLGEATEELESPHTRVDAAASNKLRGKKQKEAAQKRPRTRSHTHDAKRVKQDEPAQSAQPDKQPTPQASTGQASEASADAPSGSDRKLLPVTLLSGFLGTGKTTLLKQILQNKDNMKIAVIVNDMGAINLDASEIKKHKLIQEKEEMVELQNGCICCTLRGDLLKTVKRLSDSDEEYDHLVIESTGIAEPLPVAQTFVMDVNGDGQFHDDDQQMFSAGKQAEHAHGEGHAAGEEGDTQLEVMDGEGATSKHDPLSDYARMDTLVTVVDAFNVLGTMSSIETLADRQRLIGDEEADQEKSAQLVAAGMAPSSVVQLLLDQIEFANVILLNKIDLIPKRKRESVVAQVQSLLRKLNPSAKVLVPELPKFKDFDVSQILNTNLFDMEAAQTSAGWIAELQKPAHTPETEEYGISSLVFRESSRPFHPERLLDLFKGFGQLKLDAKGAAPASKGDAGNGAFAGVVRAKGSLWLANCDAIPIGVHTAGRQLELMPNLNNPYLIKIPQEEWTEEDKEVVQELKEKEHAWTDEFGDRSSELVCIGITLDKPAIISTLRTALLTDDELAAGPESWRKLPDPFFGGSAAAELFDLASDDEDEEDDEDDDDEEEGEDGEGGAGVKCVASKDEWDAALAEAAASGKKIIADFTATWCGPCKKIGPYFAKLAKSSAYPNLVFVKVDIDKNKEVAGGLGIQQVPAFKIIDAKAMDGDWPKEAGTLVGPGKDALKGFCDGANRKK